MEYRLKSDLIKLIPNYELLLDFCKFINQFGKIRLVGGCVRDFLIGRLATDIDLGTSLSPDKIMKLSKDYGLIVIPTGLKHGTITVMLKKNFGIEITTLRHDLNCDGRHAVVSFTSSFYEDALRRDFTINAMSYCLIEDKLYDYFDGFKHLFEKKVIFVGDAKTRIQEDYLRILRFFRFSKHYADSINEEGYEACLIYKKNLTILSQERITSEINKILSYKRFVRVFYQENSNEIYDSNTLNHNQLISNINNYYLSKNNNQLSIKNILNLLLPMFEYLNLPVVTNEYGLLNDLDNFLKKIDNYSSNLNKTYLFSYVAIFSDISFIKKMKLSNSEIKIIEHLWIVLQIYKYKSRSIVTKTDTSESCKSKTDEDKNYLNTLVQLQNIDQVFLFNQTDFYKNLTLIYVYKLIFNKNVNQELLEYVACLSQILGLIDIKIDLNMKFPINGFDLIKCGYESKEIKIEIENLQEIFILNNFDAKKIILNKKNVRTMIKK